jgi:transposase
MAPHGAQLLTAEPALLHALIGHHSRQLWSLQQTRIALCNRIKAMQRDGLAEEWCRPLVADAVALKGAEHAVDLQLARLARQHFLSGWIQDAPGIGPGGFARLVGTTGSLDRFPTVSKLWAYVGLHVDDGMAPRRRSGQRANWSAQGRVVCHQLGVAIVRVRRGRYREAYDTKKAQYMARPRVGPSECPFGQTHTTRKGTIVACGRIHAHRAAMRYAVKALLKDLWVAWRTHSRELAPQAAAA